MLAIYPDAVKLSTSSRPPSMTPSSYLHSFASHAHNPEKELSSVSMGGRTSRPVSQASNSSIDWENAVFDESMGISPGERMRYEVYMQAWEKGEKLDGLAADGDAEPPILRILVSLPPGYPHHQPPQLQLLGRYVGNYATDAGLCESRVLPRAELMPAVGDVTRTFISSSGVPFVPGDVCVFEGLTHIQSLVREWYTAHVSASASEEKQRQLERTSAPHSSVPSDDLDTSFDALSLSARPYLRASFSYTRPVPAAPHDPTEPETPPAVRTAQDSGLLPHFEIFSSAPIVDRRSTFVGHAIRVTDEREVPLVIHELLSDKKVAKAAHPAMFAYRIAREVGGAAGRVVNSDYDDDGEAQAGARLQHLLNILELENVLVVVSRWYGGTLLGADRFKHINQSARDALELGGFLEEKGKENGKESGKRRRG